MTWPEALMKFPDNVLDRGSRQDQPWLHLPISFHFMHPSVNVQFTEATRVGLEILAVTHNQLPFVLCSRHKTFFNPKDHIIEVLLPSNEMSTCR